MSPRKMVAWFLALLLLSGSGFSQEAETYDVVLAYHPVEGYEWQWTESEQGIVRCVNRSVSPHPWDEERMNVTFTFEAEQEGTTDLYFLYVPQAADRAEAEDAYLIRLCASASGQITEDRSCVYEARYYSFDGGGPEYRFELSEPELVHLTINQEYHHPDHELMDGAGYDLIAAFRGRREGSTTVTVTMNLMGMVEVVDEFVIDVDDSLCVTRREQPGESATTGKD